MIDPAIEKGHYDYTPYAYVYNNPIRLIDPFGLDSTERANAVAKYQEHVASNTTKGTKGKQHSMYVPTGTPTNAGEKGDCQSTVRGIIQETAGYDIKTGSFSTGDKEKPASGAYDIAQSLEDNEVSVEDVEVGNIYYMDYKNDEGNRRFHVGLVEKVEVVNGKTVITIIHTSFSQGPTRNTYTVGDGTYYDRNFTAYYKWDRKPDQPVSVISGQSQTVMQQGRFSVGNWIMNNTARGTGGHDIGRYLLNKGF